VDTTNTARDVETEAQGAVDGDELAWQRLWRALEPELLRIVGKPGFLGRISQHEDDRRNIVVATMERLRTDDFRRLRSYLDAKRENPTLKLISWLRVVMKRVGIDYIRAHGEYVRRSDANASSPGQWIESDEMTSGVHAQRPAMTNMGTAHELLAYAASAVTPSQLRALEMWTQSESFDDIAQALGLARPQEAEKLVRAVLERLRRHYRAS
jgi:DNA-directed RNA polymerase specialized sigma24 family protein